jgi:hypothetical protein
MKELALVSSFCFYSGEAGVKHLVCFDVQMAATTFMTHPHMANAIQPDIS